mmetsp:Transcript_763/g.2753  ORF Transcript_763/g.2753 Transcript_763/m.2753 type:complete len:325 (+) Transcript_763:1279-2253(+)
MAHTIPAPSLVGAASASNSTAVSPSPSPTRTFASTRYTARSFPRSKATRHGRASHRSSCSSSIPSFISSALRRGVSSSGGVGEAGEPPSKVGGAVVGSGSVPLRTRVSSVWRATSRRTADAISCACGSDGECPPPLPVPSAAASPAGAPPAVDSWMFTALASIRNIASSLLLGRRIPRKHAPHSFETNATAASHHGPSSFASSAVRASYRAWSKRARCATVSAGDPRACPPDTTGAASLPISHPPSHTPSGWSCSSDDAISPLSASPSPPPPPAPPLQTAARRLEMSSSRCAGSPGGSGYNAIDKRAREGLRLGFPSSPTRALS